MRYYSFFIKRILNSERCVQIKCMSEACRKSLKYLFGEEVYKKSELSYPKVNIDKISKNFNKNKNTKFLFVGTQFELKGGKALIKSFNKAYKKNPNISLDNYSCTA